MNLVKDRIHSDSIECFKLLIEHKADIFVKNKSGESIFTEINSRDEYFKILYDNYSKREFSIDKQNYANEIFPLLNLTNVFCQQLLPQLLEEYKADINSHIKHRDTLLNKYIINGSCKRQLLQLLELKADPNIEGNKNYTPFANAVKHNKIEFAQCLIDHNADINTTKYPYPVLSIAIRNSNLPMCKFLLERNVNVLQLDVEKKSSLYHTIRINSQELFILLLKHIIYNICDVQLILDECLYDVVRLKKVGFIKILIAAGANPANITPNNLSASDLFLRMSSNSKYVNNTNNSISDALYGERNKKYVKILWTQPYDCLIEKLTTRVYDPTTNMVKTVLPLPTAGGHIAMFDMVIGYMSDGCNTYINNRNDIAMIIKKANDIKTH
jgi:ankyrin repeat protein